MATAHGGPLQQSEPKPRVRARPPENALPRHTAPTLQFWIDQTIAVVLSTAILLALVSVGLVVRLLGAVPRMLGRRQELRRDWDNPEKYRNELLVKDMRYYARECGFDLEDHTVTTEDGYYLRLQRVIAPNAAKNGYPVLIMHGLFQSSGSFVTSEERSLAFWLAQQGYDVYLGNNRGIFDMGHREYSRWDPRFWDYTIHDLAQYDLSALVDYVCRHAESDTLAYVGHSQGNAILFLALHRNVIPDLGKRISYFCALAPAAYTGSLVHRFPLKYLSHVDKSLWVRLFGVMDFVPLMKCAYILTSLV